MIAIILAATDRYEMHGLDDHLPLPLFPLGDRPILHHIVDFLAAQGIRRFEFILGYLPEKIEKYLGDGARWGCSFGYHLLPPASDSLRTVESIAASLDDDDDDIVLGRGDRLPEFQISSVPGPSLLLTEEGAWTGWAILSKATSSPLLKSARSYVSGETEKFSAAFGRVVARRELSFESVQQLLRSQQDLLSGTFTGTAIEARQSQAGIWIARNVALHPSVKLVAPLYIGPNCRIEMGAKIGPCAVISDGCIVDEQSSVANSVVAPRTYVGQGLELDSVIIDRNRLVNTKLEAAFLVSDSFLLSGLARQKRPGIFRGIVSRVGAFALFLLLFPIAALTLFFLILSGKGELAYEEGVRLPTSYDPNAWKNYRYLKLRMQEEMLAGWWTYFVAEVWPGLLSVMKGDMFLVGVKPRQPREVESLPSDWRSIYLSSKAGLITEAFVMFGRRPSEDELYTAEAYYTAVESLRHDIKLLRLYMARLLFDNDREAREFVEGGELASSLENVSER